LFSKNCQEPGRAWLAANPERDPHEQSEWWSQFKPDLATLFSRRCGWLATSIEEEGIVEHYLSCGNRDGKPSPHRHLAFEWSNYRYASGAVNSRKGNHDDAILDPCEIKEGWFRVTLHGFQLLLTDAIPEALRDQAEFTIKTLDLRKGYQARRARWNWYERYWNNGKPLIELLEKDAPLVADALKRALKDQEELPDPNECMPGHPITARKRPYLRRVKCSKADQP